MITALPTMVIEHAITADDPWHQPWPPNESTGLWVLVRPLPHNFSYWRRITIKTPVMIEAAT